MIESCRAREAVLVICNCQGLSALTNYHSCSQPALHSAPPRIDVDRAFQSTNTKKCSYFVALCSSLDAVARHGDATYVYT